MANKPQDMNELVPFFAFRDNDKYKDDIFVGWRWENAVLLAD